MNKQELLHEFENGMTVRDVIRTLETMNPDTIVVNNSRNDSPVTSIQETECDYCYDEIITKRIVSIF